MHWLGETGRATLSSHRLASYSFCFTKFSRLRSCPSWSQILDYVQQKAEMHELERQVTISPSHTRVALYFVALFGQTYSIAYSRVGSSLVYG
eukprot:5596647-Pleurochrysis_carterae.AAC.3